MNNKLAGLYLSLTKALNALEDAGEDVRLDDGSAAGLSAGIEWDPEACRYVVVQA